jgi:hypothetical protein
VVSRYLLDAQDEGARLKMAEKADLLGAIRLPDTAFKENARTEVVTDIVFMRRLTPEEEAKRKEIIDAYRGPAGKGIDAEQLRRKLAEQLPDWLKADHKVKDPLGGEPIQINKYFRSNPSMIMGDLERSGSMRQAGDVTVRLDKAEDLGARLQDAVQRLERASRTSTATSSGTASSATRPWRSPGDRRIGQGSGPHRDHARRQDGPDFRARDADGRRGADPARHHPGNAVVAGDLPGRRRPLLYPGGEDRRRREEGQGRGRGQEGRRNVYERRYFPNMVVPESMRLGISRFQRLRDLVGLRDLVARQLTLEANDAPSDEMEANRGKLAAAYRSFVGQNGFLNDQKNSALLSDMPDGALVLALETSYRRGTSEAKAKRLGEKPVPPSAEPAPIMKRRVVPKWEPVQAVETPAEALQVSLSDFGRIDMDRVAGLLGKTPEEAAAALQEGEKPLVYWDPETSTWETRDDYLSGQVARKLKAAQEAGPDGERPRARRGAAGALGSGERPGGHRRHLGAG